MIDGSSQVLEVTLTPTPATITMQFFLLDASGNPYVGMAQSPIETFSVVPAEGTSSPFLTHEFVVSQLASSMVDVPDEDRDIDGETLDTIRVEFDAGAMGAGTIDGDPSTPGEQAFTIAPPGHGRNVVIQVNCMAATCTGEVVGVMDPPITQPGDTTTGGDTMPESTGGDTPTGTTSGGEETTTG